MSAPIRSELARYLRTETVGGTLLLAAAAIALIWANSPASASYFTLRDAEIGWAAAHLQLSVGSWAQDGLLAVFFFRLAELCIVLGFINGNHLDMVSFAVSE